MGVSRILPLLLVSAFLAAAAPAPSAQPVPLATILDNPGAYDGRRVRISGFLIIEFEGQGLWASEADFRNDAFERSAWLDLRLIEPEDYNHPLNGRRVFVDGVVDMGGADITGAVNFGPGAHGHLGLFATTITGITDISPDPSDTGPARPWRTHPAMIMWLLLGVLALAGGLMSWGYYSRQALREPG